MNVTVIGDGSAGQRYARLLREREHSVQIVGPSDFIQYPDPDGVIIASPPAAHEMHLRAVRGLGRPVLCEGPVTYYDHQSPWVVPNMTASNWRFVNSMLELSAILADKDIVSAHLYFDWDLYKWRPQTPYTQTCYYLEGITNINLHEVDMALWLFGPAERVHVEARSTRKSLGMDAYSMLIKHSSGVLTTIQSGWHSGDYQRGIVVQLRNGMREELTFKSPQDDYEINLSYERVLDRWLQVVADKDLTVTPNLLDGYRAYCAIKGVAI